MTLSRIRTAQEPFGQVATHAPHPMHVAASKAVSASTLGMGSALPSTKFPFVFTLMKPPAACMRSKALRSTARSLITGNAAERHGSTWDRITILELAHVQLAGGDPSTWSVRFAVDEQTARTADTLAAVVIESDRFFILANEVVVQHIQHFQERHVLRYVVHGYVFIAPVSFALLAPDLQVQFHVAHVPFLFVLTARSVDSCVDTTSASGLVRCVYLYDRCVNFTTSNVNSSLCNWALPASPKSFPRRHVGIVIVVAFCFAFLRAFQLLRLLTKMTTAALVAVQCIHAHQFA